MTFSSQEEAAWTFKLTTSRAFDLARSSLAQNKRFGEKSIMLRLVSSSWHGVPYPNACFHFHLCGNKKWASPQPQYKDRGNGKIYEQNQLKWLQMVQFECPKYKMPLFSSIFRLNAFYQRVRSATLINGSLLV